MRSILTLDLHFFVFELECAEDWIFLLLQNKRRRTRMEFTKKAYSVAAVANCMLTYGQGRNLELTNLKLQKLAYLAQGLWLAEHDGSPLFKERIEAWPYGPLIPDLYGALRMYGREEVTMPIACTDEIPADSDAANHIREVMDAFAHKSASTLIKISHMAGSPWAQVWRSGSGIYRTISLDSMTLYFKKKLQSTGAS